MDQLDKQKELSMAMNGRMALLIVGVMNVVTAVTSSALYSANMFVAVNGVIHGNKEFMDIFSEAGMNVGLAAGIGLAFALEALLEIFSGVCAVRFSNRLDKSNFTVCVARILLIVEILIQIFLVFVGMMSIAQLFSAVILPLIMLWGATRLRKLAKKYPDRVYAVESRGVQEQRQRAASGAKSLHERATMKAHTWDEGAALATGGNAAADIPEDDRDEAVVLSDEKEADTVLAEESSAGTGQ